MENNKSFKIIKIIDEYTVVVNAGVNHSINEGTKLEIYIPGKPIFDPDTNEDLGTLDTIKATLQVTKIYPKFCVCTNSEVINTTFLLTSALYKSQIRKLNIDSQEISGGFQSDDLKIKIGDLVRKCLS